MVSERCVWGILFVEVFCYFGGLVWKLDDLWVDGGFFFVVIGFFDFGFFSNGFEFVFVVFYEVFVFFL